MLENKCQKILDKCKKEQGSVISMLEDIQDVFGYIYEDAVNWLADKMNVPASNFYGVATFYSHFHFKPRGKNIVTACCGTACHVKGAEAIINRIQADLALPAGENTTPDGQFTMESVACVGACSIAPVVVVNKKVYGGETPEKASNMIKDHEKTNNKGG